MIEENPKYSPNSVSVLKTKGLPEIENINIQSIPAHKVSEILTLLKGADLTHFIRRHFIILMENKQEFSQVSIELYICVESFEKKIF